MKNTSASVSKMKQANSNVEFPRKLERLLYNYKAKEKRKAQTTEWIEKKKAQDSTLVVAYDTPPEPVGGFPAIQRKLVYPEKPRKAGVQGTVIIQAKIDENGTVVDTMVLESLEESCDHSAINAIKSVKWIPATNEGKPVTVWVPIPVKFKLK